MGMILPLSITFSTKRPFKLLRERIDKTKGNWWWSHFDRIPSALFGNNVRTRCTITICDSKKKSGRNFTTSMNRWPAELRDSLFARLNYGMLDCSIVERLPKIDSQAQADVLNKLLKRQSPLAIDLQASVPFSQLADSAPDFPQPCVYVGGTAYNWFPVWRDIPETTDVSGNPSLPARTAGYRFRNETEANIVFAILGSSIGYWWWAIASDGFNLKKWLIQSIPISLDMLNAEGKKEVARLGAKLRKELSKHYVYKDNKGRIGNFYMPACAEVTKEIDIALAKHVKGVTKKFVDDVADFNSRFSRSE